MDIKTIDILFAVSILVMTGGVLALFGHVSDGVNRIQARDKYFQPALFVGLVAIWLAVILLGFVGWDAFR